MTSIMNSEADRGYSDDINIDINIMEAWKLVDRIKTNDGSVTAYCYTTAPEVNLPIRFRVVL